MTALLDTSVLTSAHLPTEALGEKWAVSVVAIGELETGVVMAGDPIVRAARLRRLTSILDVAVVIPVDRAVSSRYALLRAASARRPTNDLWIAATALAHDLLLVTRDRTQATLPHIRASLVS